MPLDINSPTLLPEKLNQIEMMSEYARFSNQVTLILNLLDQGIEAYNSVHALTAVQDQQYMDVTANLYSELELKLKEMMDIYVGFVSNWNDLLNADEEDDFALSKAHSVLKNSFEELVARAKANRLALKTSKGEFNARGFNQITSKTIQLTRLLSANLKKMFSFLSDIETVEVFDVSAELNEA
jgi:hypothetical protein